MVFPHQIKILMFGWEFPPFNSGGLGVVCKYLTEALVKEGIKISFVLPQKLPLHSPFFKIIFAGLPFQVKAIDSILSPYLSSSSYQDLIKEQKGKAVYRPDLIGEVMRYAQKAKKIALSENFDIVHAHDWLSFPAGWEAKIVSGKPLIVHIHATEFDRTDGHNLNQEIYEIEKEGFQRADLIIAVSNFTKNKVIEHYGISPEKIKVVHNSINYDDFFQPEKDVLNLKIRDKKVVLFVGRITLQKGPDYFIRAAKRVLEKNSNVLFVIAGSGDMERQIIEEVAQLGIGDRVLFAGFLRGENLKRIYQMANLYVLSSVSEPFGLTPLEALANETPVLISKQSGVKEVLSHCLKVDFWDIEEMANKILAVLEYPALYQCLKEEGSNQVKKFNWQDSAKKINEIYKEVLSPSTL